MSLEIFFTPKIRKRIVHLITFLIIISILSNYRVDILKDGSYYWQSLAKGLLVAVAFYVNTFLLLPILFEKRNIKKYIILTLAFIILFGLMFLWFEAVSSSLFTRYTNGEKPIPSDLFFDFLSQGGLYLGLIAAYIPFSIITFIYYLLTTNYENRKKILASKYTEPLINIIVVALIFLFNFSVARGESLFRANFVTILFMLFFYCNTFLLTPFILKENNKIKYFAFLAILFVAFEIIMLIIIDENRPEQLLTSFLVMLFLFSILTIVSFSYGYFRFKLKNQSLKLGVKNSELQLLKSQVNPHFLFNTLNTLYATALEENAPKTAGSTAKLANLLRYMQNDISKDFIPLENEIKYLEDYIAIQKIRCEIAPEIKTHFINIGSKKISPGLLIPFVENAFKYGIDPSKPSVLNISVICSDNTIGFECTNSYNDAYTTYYKEQGFGIGITNTKQRLELVYPKKHTLAITKENNLFTVKLDISIE